MMREPQPWWVKRTTIVNLTLVVGTRPVHPLELAPIAAPVRILTLQKSRM